MQGTDGAAATIIDGDSATDNYYVVIISASDVTLSGFTITNPLYSGTADASGVLIESMTNNAPLTGVNVTGNVIHDIGVLDRASAFATLGVNVEGVNPGSGVSDSTIQDNTIYNIGNADPTSFAVGVLTAGDVNMEVNNVSISGNTIYNVSNASLAAGVDVGYGSENVTVDDNTVGLNGSSAGPVGVGIRTGSGVFGPVTISDDTVENASVAGVQLDSPFSQTVTGGTYEADAVGVEVQNGTATLQDLNLSSDGTGFTASNVAALTLSDLTLTGDTQGGTISNVTTVNDTPTTGGAGVTTTITGSFFQSSTNQAVDYTGVQSLNVTGSVGGDVFEVTPAAATTITVHGGLPTPPASPGDVLNVTLAGATDPVLNDSYSSSSGYSGGWTVGNRAAVNFDDIETLSPSGPEVAVLKTSGELDLLTPGTNAKVEISPAGSIRAVVATIDASFNNDIFAISELPGYAGTLWEYSDASGWMEISSGSFAQISATTNASGQAVVFGVLADGSLWEQDPAGAGRDVGWTRLSPAGTIRSVGAVTDSTGAVVAVAISNLPGYAGTVWEHTDASGWQEESSGSFTQVSADLNASGQAIIFGMLSDGSLWEQDPAGAGLNVGWTERSGASNVLSVTAGGVGDEAFVIETNHNVYRLTPSGLTQLSSNGTVESVSATATQGQDEVFAVMTDGSLWEYSPNFPGNHFEEILSGGVASSAVATSLHSRRRRADHPAAQQGYALARRAGPEMLYFFGGVPSALPSPCRPPLADDRHVEAFLEGVVLEAVLAGELLRLVGGVDVHLGRVLDLEIHVRVLLLLLVRHRDDAGLGVHLLELALGRHGLGDHADVQLSHLRAVADDTDVGADLDLIVLQAVLAGQLLLVGERRVDDHLGGVVQGVIHVLGFLLDLDGHGQRAGGGVHRLDDAVDRLGRLLVGGEADGGGRQRDQGGRQAAHHHRSHDSLPV